MENLPTLVTDSSGLSLLALGDKAVVTIVDLAKALEYNDRTGINKVFNRNKESFNDIGFYERVGQNVIPFDAAIVRLETNGGPQDIRVFSKRGALKICMKSNQPKAIAVQEMLLDLYERVESGQIVSVAAMQKLTDIVHKVDERMTKCEQRSQIAFNLKNDKPLPIAIERGVKRRTTSLIARNIGARTLALKLLKEGKAYDFVAAELRDTGFETSKSAVGRFSLLVRAGKLKEFGVDIYS